MVDYSNAYILSTAYRTRNDSTFVQLYCKTARGNTIVVEDHMNPYCYIQGMYDADVENLLRDDRVLSITPTKKRLRSGKKVKMHKVEVIAPKHVKQIRDGFKNRFGIWRADVVYPINYLYTNKLGCFINIEGKYRDHKYIDPKVTNSHKEFVPKPKVMCFDIENSMQDYRRIFTIGVAMGDKTWSFTGDERSIITDFFNCIHVEDPDIIGGYNIDEYDWLELERACKRLGIKMSIGRDGSDIFIRGSEDKEGNTKHDVKIIGRVSLDMWKYIKKERSRGAMKNLKRERLQDVAEYYDIEGKLDVMASNIDDEWAKDKDKVVEYCKQDAKIVADIIKESGAIDKIFHLSNTSHLPFEEVRESTSSRMVDSKLIRAMDELEYATPTNQAFDKDAKKKKIQGAHVFEPIAGAHPYVGFVDYKSLYPSIMIEHNICWTTVCDDEKDDSKVHKITFQREIKDEKNRVIDIEFVTHKFYKKDIKEGVLPGILIELMDGRKDAKKMKKEATSKKKKQYYDGLQNAIKVLMNSFYGLLTSSFYRYTDKAIGESITAYARKNIKESAMIAEDLGFVVLAGDTDSLGLSLGCDNVEDATTRILEISQLLSKGNLIMEPEKIYETWFSSGKKKRYFGNIVWPVVEDEIEVKGFENVRVDTFSYQRDLLKILMEKVVEHENMNKVLTAIGKKLKRFNVNHKELILSRSVKREEDYKFPDRQIGVRMARKMVALGYPFIAGQRMEWIVTDGGISPMEAEPVIEGREMPEPDIGYYRSRTIRTILPIAEVYGFDEGALLTGMKATTLEGWS